MVTQHSQVERAILAVVMKDIHRIELPTVFGMKTVNAFLIKGDKITLVDTGENTSASIEALSKGLSGHGLKLSDIDEVIITHAHVDHIGAGGTVAQECDAIFKVSDIVAPWAVDNQRMFFYREQVLRSTMKTLLPEAAFGFFAGYYEDFRKKMGDVWKDIPEDRIEVFNISDGVISINDDLWDVIYTPGHSNTQTCFHNTASKQFLAADMLLKITPTPVIEPITAESTERDKSILKLLQSFDLVRSLDIETVYPGHYELIHDHVTLIDYQVKRIHERKDQALEYIKSGIGDFSELFNKMYKGRWHLPALVMMIGYIDLLVAENKVTYNHEQSEGIRVI